VQSELVPLPLRFLKVTRFQPRLTNGKTMWKKTICLLTLLLGTTAWAGDREITVELTVPDASWEIAIDGVYRVGDELWVIAAVSQNPDIMGAQVISTIQAALVLDAPDLPEQYFVLGKTWNWPNQESYRFLDSLKPIEAELKSGKLLYRREEGNCPFW
jgi:hypothetical protein